MVGWVDKELAPGVAASLRHFKVTLSLWIVVPLGLGFQSSSSCSGSPGPSRVVGPGVQTLILNVPYIPSGGNLACAGVSDRYLTCTICTSFSEALDC